MNKNEDLPFNKLPKEEVVSTSSSVDAEKIDFSPLNPVNRESEQQEYFYGEIERKVGEVNEVFEFIFEEIEKKNPDFSEAITDFYNTVFTRQPDEVKKKFHRLEELHQGEKSEASQEEFKEIETLENDPQITFLEWMQYVVRKLAKQAEFLRTGDETELREHLVPCLKVDFGELNEEDYSYEIIGPVILVSVNKPSLREDLLAFHIPSSPFVFIDKTKISSDYPLDQTIHHEIVHALCRYLPYKGVLPTKIELNELAENFNRFTQEHGTSEAYDHFQGEIEHLITMIFEQCGEELVADEQALKEKIKSGEYIAHDLGDRMEDYWEYITENISHDFPFLQKAFDEYWPLFRKRAMQLSSPIYALYRANHEDYVRDLYVLFSVTKSGRWHSVARRVVGEEKYQQYMQESDETDNMRYEEFLKREEANKINE